MTDDGMALAISEYQPGQRTLAEREEFIARAIEVSNRYRWHAFFELYEIKQRNLWQQVRDGNNEPVFHFWDDYVADLGQRIPQLSRRLVFERLSMIKRYRNLGMGEEELVERSPAALRELSTLVNWDNRNGTPSDGHVSVDEFKMLLDDTKDLATADVRAIVEQKRGETRRLFFCTIVPHRNHKAHLRLRAVDEDGEVFMLTSAEPWAMSMTIELCRRLGIEYEVEELG